MPEDDLFEPVLPRPARSRHSAIWAAVLVAFLLGLGAAGWLGWRSGADFGRMLGGPYRLPPPAAALPPATAFPGSAAPEQLALAARISAMEQRLDRIDLREAAALEDTARAEALLVAFAVRRVAERGAPLGYLADQLKLRFGDAQPDAVATIIAGARDGVPLDRLAARLEALAPELTQTGQQSLWGRITGELAELFVVRRDQPVQSQADAGFNAARQALSEGRIDEAIALVQHLSGSSEAARWITDARRYRDVERALDLIDTAALLSPRSPRDGAGATGRPLVQ